MGRWKTTCLCILYLEIVTFFYTTTAAQNGKKDHFQLLQKLISCHI